jgi:hypothetical protein
MTLQLMSAHLDAALEDLDAGLHAVGDHTSCDPNTCFAAKMRYWRTHGANIVTRPMLTREVSALHGPTKREFLDEHVGLDNIKSGAAVPKDKGRWV